MKWSKVGLRRVATKRKAVSMLLAWQKEKLGDVEVLKYAEPSVYGTEIYVQIEPFPRQTLSFVQWHCKRQMPGNDS